VEEGAPVAGKTLAELDIPPNVIVSAVLRDGSLILPKGDTVLQPDDEVIALANRENEEAFREMMTGD
jgi:Trk K+ transport system NAD-binding subunit